MQISSSTHRILSGLLEARTGQQLTAGRHWRVEMALTPILKAYGMATCDELAAQLSGPNAERLCDDTVDALLNNETYFFRDSDTFAHLPEVVETIAANRRDCKRLRVWSAGCSTGQEIYSLAMQFREKKERWQGWTIDLLGTDISRKATRRADNGEYSQFEIQRGLPARHMLRWFEHAEERWTISRNLRDMVRFQRHNLLDRPPLGRFDLILCRNVLLYFPPDNRKRALENIAGALAPDGALMLGAGETVLGYCDKLEILPGVRSLYRLAKAEPERLSVVA